MRRSIVQAVVILAMVTPSDFVLRAQPPQNRFVEDPEAYAVYASLLPAEWSVRGAHAKRLVFQRETVTNWECMPSGKPLETDWKIVVDDFRSANAGVRLLRAGFSLGIPYVAVPAAEIQSSLRAVPSDPFGWTSFYTRYPDSGGIMMVSVVGFDRGKRRAMVYMANTCGSLCGSGAHHLLEKVGGRWREARVAGVSDCSWVS